MFSRTMPVNVCSRCPSQHWRIKEALTCFRYTQNYWQVPAVEYCSLFTRRDVLIVINAFAQSLILPMLIKSSTEIIISLYYICRHRNASTPDRVHNRTCWAFIEAHYLLAILWTFLLYCILFYKYSLWFQVTSFLSSFWKDSLVRLSHV